jgi:UDP-N-acetylmuramoyl-tripeptide--D-alanyl-D-alanine ligase
LKKWGFLFPENMQIEQLYRLFEQHPRISTDTRKIIPDSIFFALKGDSFNGNLFAIEALEKGAAYAVVDEAPAKKDERLVQVKNSLTCLQQLAAFHRKKLGIPVLAITGTNGKTTTKELTAAVLSMKYKLCFTQGNLNNHIGVPLTLLQMDMSTEMAVIEMGANHPGEIDALCQIATPDFGLITNVGKAHLEGFGSFEGVVQTKTELYRFLKSKNGKCFVHSGDPVLRKHAGILEHICYGQFGDDFLQGELVSTDYYIVAKALFPKGWLYLKSKLIGSYNFDNILAAACIGHYFKIDPLLIQKAIENYTPSNNRSQLIETGTNKIIMDAYNANPTSMMAALQNFILINHPEKVLILGDMLELGPESETEHQKIVDFISANKFEQIFLVGKNFSQTNGPKTKKFDNAELLTDYLTKQPFKNKLILIKGSRGISLEKILGNL